MYIKFPEGDDLKNVIDGFERKWDFPSCAGAIDGTHVLIVAPQEITQTTSIAKGGTVE